MCSMHSEKFLSVNIFSGGGVEGEDMTVRERIARLSSTKILY